MTPDASVPVRSRECTSAALTLRIDPRSSVFRWTATLLAIILCSVWPAHRAAACTDVSGDISSAVTWGPTGSPADTCYHVTGTITVKPTGALTIQPGTHVYFNAATKLSVTGIGNSSYGTLTANGTAAMPIVFAARSGLRGGWLGIEIHDGGGSFEHCIFRDGGELSHAQFEIDGQFTGIGASLTLASCVFEHHFATGLDNRLGYVAITVTGCTFRDYGGYPMSTTLGYAVSAFPSNSFVGSARFNAVEIKTVGPYGSGSWGFVTLPVPPAGFCYAVSDTLNLDPYGNGSITFNSGTLIKSAGGLSGKLIANGVTFTSLRDDTLGDTNGDGATTAGGPGQWRGISLPDGASLDGCEIRFAGADGASLVLYGGSATNCVIERGAGNGVFGRSSSGGTFTGNLIRQNDQFEVGADARWYQLHLASNTFAPSGTGAYDAYELFSSSDPAATLPVPPSGFCYAVAAQLGSTSTITIQPGTLLKFERYAGIAPAGGNVVTANGAVFTSFADDTLGDTNGDGPSAGSAGQWTGIELAGGSATLVSCSVRFAGQGGAPSVNMPSSGPAIAGCRFANGLGPALRTTAAQVSGLLASNSFAVSTPASFNAIDLVPGTITNDLTLPLPPSSFCYVLLGLLGVEAPAAPRFTIPSGTVMKFGLLGQMRVGVYNAGRLMADGVVFTSLADDTLGDTGGDGPTTGDTGQWRDIDIDDHDTGSTLSCSIIRYGGAIGAELSLINSSPLIQNCLFGGADVGIKTSSAGQRPVIYGCVFQTGVGVAAYLTASPVIARCDFSGVSSQGVTANALVVQAQNCWWGAASGPYDPSPDPPDQNASGTGVPVSDHVAYRPWLTSAPAITCPTSTGVEPQRATNPARLELLGVSPNPGTPPWRVRFAAPQAGMATIELIDIAGRRLTTRDVVVPGPGVHDALLPLDASLRPGMCFVVLRLAGGSVSVRAALLR